MPLHEDEKVSPRWFTPTSQEDEEPPTRFRIRPLTSPEFTEVGRNLREPNLNMAIGFGLIGWENFLSKNDTQIVFKRSKFSKIPKKDYAEIANEIYYISSLTEEEAKNS